MGEECEITIITRVSFQAGIILIWLWPIANSGCGILAPTSNDDNSGLKIYTGILADFKIDLILG